MYITGQNLVTFSNYEGLDPEVGGSIISRGIDRDLISKEQVYNFRSTITILN